MRMGQPSQRHDWIVWETEMTEPTCQQLMLKWEKGREKHEGPVCGLSNHVRRIRHGGGCDGVSEQSGRFHSQQPETQQAARGTRSSWCPGLTLPSLRCPEQKQELDPLRSAERVGRPPACPWTLHHSPQPRPPREQPALLRRSHQGHLPPVCALMSQPDSQ